MRVWIDPKETAASAWGGEGESPESAASSSAVPVVERAAAVRRPIQYTDGAFVTPMADETAGGDHDGYARIQFNCAVDRAGTVKLTARGYRWGSDDPDMRFKSLFSREASPTDTVPFDTYERWLRVQHGEVRGFKDGDEYIHFEPTEGAIDEGRERRAWSDLKWAISLRLAELELVRNTAFARYRLQELGEWDAVRGTLRWKPTAFGGP